MPESSLLVVYDSALTGDKVSAAVGVEDRVEDVEEGCVKPK